MKMEARNPSRICFNHKETPDEEVHGRFYRQS
jgi:hypothetical protein